MAKSIIDVLIRADSKGLTSGLAQADSRLAGFGKKFAKGVAILGGGLAAGAVLAKPFIDAGSDINESLSKVDQIFGEASDSVVEFSDRTAKMLGISKQAALDAAGTFGVFGKAAGLSGPELSSFSNEFTQLAADLASFNNTTPEEAIEAIGAALRGESEPLRSYGVLLDDARLRQEAMELGIYDGNGALTAQQKILAAQRAIFEDTGDAQGDFAKTSEGLANRQRILSARLADVQAKIGAALLPVALALGDALVDKVIPAIEDMADWLGERLPPVLEVVAGVFRDQIIPAVRTAAQFLADRIPPAVEFVRNAFQRLVDIGQGIRDFVSRLNELGLLQPILIGLATVIGGALVIAFGAWAISAGAAAVATAAAFAPVIAIGVALAALVAGIIYAYQNWEWFRDIVDGVAAFMVDTVWPAIQTVAAGIADAFQVMAPIVVDIFTSVKNVAVDTWNQIQSAFFVAAGIISTIIDAVVAAVQMVIDIMQAVWDAVTAAWDGITSAFDVAAGFVAGAVGGVVSAVQSIIDIVNAMLSPIQAAIGGLKELFSLGSQDASFIIDTANTISAGAGGGGGTTTGPFRGRSGFAPDVAPQPVANKISLTVNGREIAMALQEYADSVGGIDLKVRPI